MIEILDLVKLLLPWPFYPEHNLVTNLFIYVIFLFWIVSLIWFVIRIDKRIRSIRELASEVKKHTRPARPEILTQLEEKFSLDSQLSDAWQELKDSLVTRDGSNSGPIVYKTEEASFYINEERLLAQHLNLRFWNSVPTILVGLGILGTFIGMVSGLMFFSSDVDFARTEAIQDAIEGLISGVSIAFVTSVWGMLTSLVFNVVEKACIGWAGRQIAELQRCLDRIFTLTTQEDIAFRQEDELAQQTAALKSFSTDLANEIKSAMVQGRREIVQELQKAPNAFSDAMANRLAPSLAELNAAVQALREQKEESSTEAVGKLVEEFRNSISGETVSQMETLASTVDDVSRSLRDLPGQMADMMENVQKQIDDASINMSEMSEEQIAQWNLMQEGMRKTFKEGTEALNVQLATSNDAMASSRDMLQQMNESVTGTRQLIEITRVYARQLSAGSVRLENAGQELTLATNAFKVENEKHLVANRETTRKIQDMITSSTTLLGDFAQKFQTIESGLRSIFSEIENGLNTYAVTTRESVEDYLHAFSNQLTKAANALSDSSIALHASVEELNDSVEELKDRNG